MGHRLTKIYTRTGDSGDTGLGDGSRVDKDHPRIEACGTIDELNSLVGMVLAHPLSSDIRACLVRVQHDLFDLGGELSIPGHQLVAATHTERLEQDLDGFNAELPPLKEFILPGGDTPTATCHLARTVCRRAERRLVTLARSETVNPSSLSYLNRLSDLLFVIARRLGATTGRNETMWARNRNSDQDTG